MIHGSAIFLKHRARATSRRHCKASRKPRKQMIEGTTPSPSEKASALRKCFAGPTAMQGTFAPGLRRCLHFSYLEKTTPVCEFLDNPIKKAEDIPTGGSRFSPRSRKRFAGAFLVTWEMP